MRTALWGRMAAVALVAAATVTVAIPAKPALAFFPTTSVGPGAGNSGNRSFVAVTDNLAGQILYNYWDLGGNGVWSTIPNDCPSSTSPAVSLVGNGSYVFVIVRSTSGGLCLNQTSLNGWWVGWSSMGFTTSRAPAAGSSGNRTLVAATSTDGRIFYDQRLPESHAA